VNPQYGFKRQITQPLCTCMGRRPGRGNRSWVRRPACRYANEPRGVVALVSTVFLFHRQS